MSESFRNALMWHMERHGTKIIDLVESAGVSRDVINKLKARADSTTTVEIAVKIAAYYGKSINQFLALKEVSREDRIVTLLELLPPEAQQLLEEQVEGLVRLRNASK